MSPHTWSTFSTERFLFNSLGLRHRTRVASPTFTCLHRRLPTPLLSAHSASEVRPRACPVFAIRGTRRCLGNQELAGGQFPGSPGATTQVRSLEATVEENASKPQLPRLGSQASSKWQANWCPAPRPQPEPGSTFSTVDRGVRSASAAQFGRGAPGVAPPRAEPGVGAGRGPRGFGSGWRCLLPPRLPLTSSAKVTAPLRLLSRLGAGGVSWLRAEQRGWAASSHSVDAESARPAPAAQITATLAAVVHRRSRQPATRARSPGPPRRLALSSAFPAGHWDQPSARGMPDARPVRAIGREEGTVTWDQGVQRCGLGRARLGAVTLPWPLGSPHPCRPWGAAALPLSQPAGALAHPAPVYPPLKAWRADPKADWPLRGDGLQLPSPPRAELPAAEDHQNLATAMLKAPLHTFGQASHMKVPATSGGTQFEATSSNAQDLLLTWHFKMLS
ncbi:uncharacterized protein LOC129398792 [Sorex araneus]|uniref:uncharacterized protein LOC129398792 n=1 Tax=Sorex araneus TaxID=42254 RepID=UPI0024338400|nr:uncharacterized protein LOC129398792 [Sorex araneus]